MLRALAGLVVAIVAAGAWLWIRTAREVERLLPGLRAEAARLAGTGVALAEVPPEWRAILLAVEDPAFERHRGIDLRTPGAGLTTITQGLAKRYCFERFEPGPLAKLKQSIAAWYLDRGLGKEPQLVLFLNSASFGPGREGWVEGFEAAAREYHGKPFAELTRQEFVTLVAMLVGPVTFHPVRGAAALADRVARIENLLRGECAPSGLRDVYYARCG